jgi:hypothetical protein
MLMIQRMAWEVHRGECGGVIMHLRRPALAVPRQPAAEELEQAHGVGVHIDHLVVLFATQNLWGHPLRERERERERERGRETPGTS